MSAVSVHAVESRHSRQIALLFLRERHELGSIVNACDGRESGHVAPGGVVLLRATNAKSTGSITQSDINDGK